MLEGLEASVIRKSELNEELRNDAEFFRKRYLREDSALSRCSCATLGSFASVTDGPHGYHVVDEASPIAMLTAKNARGWFADREDADCIAKWVDDKNKRSSLENGDIILSDRGTVGMCALVTKDALPANIDQDVARISWVDRKRFRPEYVVTYLNASFGQDHIERYSTGMVQQGITLQKIREIPIPILSPRFQSAVAETVQAAYRARCEAGKRLEQAETTLLDALGLRDWQPPEPLTYTRSSKEVLAAERLDSEYFAPRVEELLTRLAKDGRRLRDVATARTERFSPSGNGVFRYLEIGGIQSDGTIVGETVELSEAPSRATWYVREGDVLTSTVRPNRRLSAMVTDEQDGFVASSGFVVLQPKRIRPEVLLSYLRLPVFCDLMGLHTSASLYPAISEQDLLNLPIPKVQETICRQVVVAVQSGHVAKRQADKTLARAKRAVEVAIEEGETAGLAALQEGQRQA